MIVIVLIIIFVSAAAAAFSIFQNEDNPKARSSEKNDNSSNSSYVFKGEDFSFYDLDGNVKHLSDYTGKIVVLDLWATWCKPCQYQLLELERMNGNYSNDQLMILSINIDESENVATIQSFIDGISAYVDLNWTVGRDKNNNLDKYMPEGYIPTLCIFDQNGTLSFRHKGLASFEGIPSYWPPGEEPPETLKDKIDALLN